jgi:hypothetical protein
MQYSGQYSFHGDNINTEALNGENFFIQIFFYTCITKDFVIFSINEKEGLPKTDFPYFSLGV